MPAERRKRPKRREVFCCEAWIRGERAREVRPKSTEDGERWLESGRDAALLLARDIETLSPPETASAAGIAVTPGIGAGIGGGVRSREIGRSTADEDDARGRASCNCCAGDSARGLEAVETE